MKKGIAALLLIAIILSSCNTGNKFTSTFGKRKYTKGYFVDVPYSYTRVTANTNPLSKTKQVSVPSVMEPTHIAIATKPVTNQANKIVIRKASLPVQSIKSFSQAKTTTIIADSITTKNSDRFKETNWVAVTGCIISIVGIILTIPTTALTLLAGIALGLGVIVCIYSLYLNKIYLNWAAVVGLSLTILLLALLLL